MAQYIPVFDPGEAGGGRHTFLIPFHVFPLACPLISTVPPPASPEFIPALTYIALHYEKQRIALPSGQVWCVVGGGGSGSVSTVSHDALSSVCQLCRVRRSPVQCCDCDCIRLD